MRLYIVAGNIPAEVVRVCRFLRTTHGLDINCISVATFQTEESDEAIVSMETIVGEEDVSMPRMQRRTSSHSSQLSRETERQIVWETVLEITGGNVDIEFDLQSVRDAVLKKHPNFKPNTVAGILVADTANNDPAFPSSGEDKYWRIARGVYRLNCEEKNSVADSVDSV